MTTDTSMADLATLHDHVANQLTQHDQRYTSGRRQLVETLSGIGNPATLPDILQAAPDLTQSSAYRNLDVLERSGVIRRLTTAHDHAHYELAEPLLGHHHHLICVQCESIADVHLDHDTEELVLSRLHSAAQAQGFTPIDHTLDLHGICKSCSKSDS